MAKASRISNIPRFAEDLFVLLSTQYGAQCTRTDQDERGWDFLIELPHSSGKHAPLDMRPTPRKCLVQIKSTVSPRSSVVLKLSNAYEFAKAMEPCFVVLFITNAKQTRISSVRIQHFWEADIAATLHRVRELDHIGDAALHKREITLKCETRLKPSDLFEFMSKTVERVGPWYETIKRHIVEGVGFSEKGNIVCTLQFDRSIMIDQFIEAQLNLGTQLPITEFKGHSLRFGITSREPVFKFNEGYVRFDNKPFPARMRFSCERLGRAVMMDADLYYPIIFDIPPEKLWFRAVNKLVELHFHLRDGSGSLTVLWSLDLVVTLEELLKFVQLLLLFQSSDVFVELEFSPGGTKIQFPGWLRDLSVPQSPVFQQFALFLLNTIKYGASSVDLRAFSIALKDTHPKIPEVMVCNRWLAPETMKGRFNNMQFSGTGYVLFCAPFFVGNQAIYFIGRRHAISQAQAEGGFAVTLDPPDFVECRSVDGSFEENEVWLSEIFIQKMRAWSGENNMVIFNVHDCSSLDSNVGFS